jgi:hypothetical protein
MKKLFTLTMLISLAMICSCQKQGSVAERQLAQRKAELDAREKALDEREKALDEREKALAERESPTVSAPAVPSVRQSRDKVSDPEQVKAEFERRLQQLPPDTQQLIVEPPQVKDKDDKTARRREERIARKRERRAVDAANAQQDAMSAGAAYPASEATSPPPLAVYPQPEATSPPSLEASPEALLTRLVKIGRQLGALFCKITSVLERVDGIDVLIAPDCLNLAKRSAVHWRDRCWAGLN